MKKTGYTTFVHLCGLVFADRDFVAFIDENGLDAAIKRCPVNDLSDDQRQAFEAAFKHRRLRRQARKWWSVYDHLRDKGEIPQARAPWQP